MIKKNKAIEFIDSQKALNKFVTKLGNETSIAIDTEFERIRSYFPKLCLIQIASRNSLACIDCLANLDLSPFWSVLYREDIEKILHSGLQDLEIFYLENQSLPQNLFDTQIAASLVGYPMQIGIKNLLMEELNIHISKSETRSNWSKRPLDNKQVNYAIEDVAYLIELKRSLKQKLKLKERLDWNKEECAAMLNSKTGLMDQDNIWKKTQGIKKLNSKFQGIAKGLANWREAKSAEKNIPRKWLMEDSDIIKVSKMNQSSLRSLQLEFLLNNHMNQQDLNEILKVIQSNSGNIRGHKKQKTNRAKKSQKNKIIVEKISDYIARQSKKLGLVQEVLATKKDIVLLAQGRDSRLKNGWRKTELGQGIEEIVNTS